ncbi:hypothetical protein FCL40_01135 [Ferrimonas sediminicola]|uniref:Uncharacterized protein n=1 Tax=Ferrimonas sediminicola TaxID=2569538 RepID=A0A4U1BIC1_9GAMM|nr:hypothetical protein [Ferrimonas sediminicola]TKB51190.1 hypothetical protein FCL40_01135 [Ferrimonas sediminicola]
MKGKSGQQLAGENVAKVKAWIDDRNRHRDWHEYAFNNRINRCALAEELDFSTSVCTQNKAVRALLEAADELWFTNEEMDKASHDAAHERALKRTGQISSTNNALTRRVAELEAENRSLRRQLDAYKELEALISAGSPGFRP